MLFNSYEFIFVFLPGVYLGYLLTARLGVAGLPLIWLFGASLFFYGYWNPRYLIVLIISLTLNFAIGLFLARAPSHSKRTKPVLIFGIGLNLAAIGYFKYANFFSATANQVLGSDFHLPPIVLPLAISFFTFQQITYLVDSWRGQTREYSFLRYCLFVTFFPQLIAGPIVHHSEMMPQFREQRKIRFDVSDLSVGVTIFAFGLFKKVVIADNLALVATPVFSAAEAGEPLHFFQSARGIFAYSLQLYFDFSGYTDMAIGAARIFGIRLPLNFNAPYRALNIIDFWRRWHITLSRFLRDYVYIPLGGNRNGVARKHVNLLLTMLLGGLWHGAGWTFVFWGALHGIYLIANHLWLRFSRPINRWWSRAFSRVLTLGCVMFAWIFFRAESFSGAIRMIDGLGNLPYTLEAKLGAAAPVLATFGIKYSGPWISESDLTDIGWAVFWIGILWLWPTTQQIMAKFEPTLSSLDTTRLPNALHAWAPSFRWAAVVSVTSALALLNLNHVSEFLYFQF